MSQPTQTKLQTADNSQLEYGLGMKIYAVIWWSVFALFTVYVVCMAVLLQPLRLFDRRQRYVHLMTMCIWGWAVYFFNPFWTLKVEGRKNIPMDGRGIIVPTHDSLADILVCGALFRPFKFVSKESVFRVPFMGWAMTLSQYIPVKRGDAASVAKMYADCTSWLEREVPILLYPEGSRSPDGNVQQFKDGAFKLAIETQSPLFPVVLAGTRNALPKHGYVAPLQSHVRVKVLDPVYPAEFQNNLDALREHVRTVMVAEKARQTELLYSEHPEWALSQ